MNAFVAILVLAVASASAGHLGYGLGHLAVGHIAHVNPAAHIPSGSVSVGPHGAVVSGPAGSVSTDNAHGHAGTVVAGPSGTVAGVGGHTVVEGPTGVNHGYDHDHYGYDHGHYGVVAPVAHVAHVAPAAIIAPAVSYGHVGYAHGYGHGLGHGLGHGAILVGHGHHGW